MATFRASFSDGSSGSPITEITPTVSVSRREAIAADTQGGQNAALYVESVGTNVSNDAGGINAQTNALTVYANQTSTGHGDVVAGFFNSTQDGVVGTAPSPHSAYGLFSQASITRNGTNAYGLEVFASNSTGTNYTWTGTYPIAAAMHVGTAGANRASAGIWVYTGSNPTFDIGLVFDVNSTNTYSIYDVSSAGTSIYLAGSHTNGINTTGGTFSGKAILGTGYSIDNAGAIVGSAITAKNNQNGNTFLNANNTNPGSGANAGAAFTSDAGTLNLFVRSSAGGGRPDYVWNGTGNMLFWAQNASPGDIVFAFTGSVITPLTIKKNGAVFGSAVATPASTTKTTDYTVLYTDSSLIFNGSGTITLTLMSAAAYPGRWLYLKNVAAFPVVSASSNVVPRSGGAAGTAILAASAGAWAWLQSDGTNWIVMAGS